MHLNLAGFGRQDNLSEIFVLEPEEKVTLAGLDIDCTDPAEFLWVLVRLASLGFSFLCLRTRTEHFEFPTRPGIN